MMILNQTWKMKRVNYDTMSKYTTQVPNIIFDLHLPALSESELKVLLVIIRQTIGWIDPYTKRRKTRDWISHSQFIKKTNLSRKSISEALKSLCLKNIIRITNFKGEPLFYSWERKGKKKMWYELKT
jgi:phage replication O-like protein O